MTTIRVASFTIFAIVALSCLTPGAALAQGNPASGSPGEAGAIVAWGLCGFEPCAVPAINHGITAISAGAGQLLALTEEGSIIGRCPPPLNTRCDVPEPNRDFVALSAGWYHGLGLKSDGSIVGWGFCIFGQCDPPLPNVGYVAVAASKFHSLALRADGSVVTFGCADPTYDFGQCALPQSNAGFVAVAAEMYHNLALRADGSVAAWGCQTNDYGQCNVPEPNTGFVAIDAGYWHSIGLKADGTVIEWGRCGIARDVDSGVCTVFGPGSGVVSVAAGGEHSMALRSDGTIASWGRNDAGQTDVPFPNAGFTSLAAGGYASFAIAADCNANEIPDTLETINGWSPDCNRNGTPDDCELHAVSVPASEPLKNRYISFVPGNAGLRIAFRVTLRSILHPDDHTQSWPNFSMFEGQTRWVGPPTSPIIDGSGEPFAAARLQCQPYFRDWGDIHMLHVFGSEIVPSSLYDVDVFLEGCNPSTAPDTDRLVTVETAAWGDIVEPYAAENAPLQPDMLDVVALVNKFSSSPQALPLPRVQLQPRIVDPLAPLNFLDISLGVDAFVGIAYPTFLGPMPCP